MNFLETGTPTVYCFGVLLSEPNGIKETSTMITTDVEQGFFTPQIIAENEEYDSREKPLLVRTYSKKLLNKHSCDTCAK